jgi:hypothetical protein
MTNRTVCHGIAQRWVADGVRGRRAEVDIAVMTPANFAALALRGLLPFDASPMPDLRAIARQVFLLRSLARRAQPSYSLRKQERTSDNQDRVLCRPHERRLSR